MTKKQNAFWGTIGLIIGIIGGVAGTSFTLGAEKQHINDQFARYQRDIIVLQDDNEDHEQTIREEMDRYTIIMSQQMLDWQRCIRELTETVQNLRTDVGILKVIVERIEKKQDHSPSND